MRLVPLGSGSRGNATFVELAGTRLLVDAGLSARQLSLRLAAIDVDPRSLDWVVVSHEHDDHARGAERFSRTHDVPVLCSHGTLAARDLSPACLAGWRPLEPTRGADLGSVWVEAFPVPHDAAEPVGFVLHGGGVRVGLATDLGHATPLVRERLRSCDVLLVEANHDARMLAEGPYPWHLKQRVAGRLGHLSNGETAALLAEVLDERCRAVVLAHLSEHNNTPHLARETVGRVLARRGLRNVAIHVASNREPTPGVELPRHEPTEDRS